jgi:hypothetical protein
MKKLVWPHDRRRRFLNISDWDDFESRLLDLDGLIFPVSRKSKRKDHSSQEPLMTERADAEIDARINGAFLGASALRDQSLQTNHYNRADLETEGQGYGAMPVSPIDRSTSDVGLNQLNGSGRGSGHTSQAHLAPPLAGYNTTHSGRSSGELYEADTDISLVQSDRSSVPLRPVERQRNQNFGPPGGWGGYTNGYGYGQGYNRQ